MTGLFQDVRYAFRQLGKNPGFAATAIVVLAIGLGATTGMLAVVDSVLVRPLGYRDSGRLMAVGVSREKTDDDSVYYPDYQDMRRELRQFEDFGAYMTTAVPVETSDGTQMVVAPYVTTNLLDLLGVRPELGRTMRVGDDKIGDSAVVVSHSFWQRFMHGRPDVLGSSLKVDNQRCTVVGVMPPHFQFPLQMETVWPALQLNSEHKTSEGFDRFDVLGRLKPGITLQQARAEGEAFVRNRAPSSHDKESARFWLLPYQRMVTKDKRPALLAFLGACLLLLLIAVANVANLQIARATGREAEIGMRAALGATRGRILRQLVVESLVLCCAGAIAGWFVALGFIKAASHLFQDVPLFDQLHFDGWTFTACGLLTTFCGVGAALGPAWYMLGSGRNPSFHQNALGRASRRQRLTGVFVTVQVAITCMLLVGTGLFVRTLRRFQNEPLGFSSENVTGFILWSPSSGGTAAAKDAYQRILSRLQSMSQVEAAGMLTSFPYSNSQMVMTSSLSIPGHPVPASEKPEVRLLAGSNGYFKSLRIPILAGRNFIDGDGKNSHMVGIINRSFAEAWLNGVDPVGKEIVLDEEDPVSALRVTVVGVSGDVGHAQDGHVGPEMVLPFQQLPASQNFAHFLIGWAAWFGVRARGKSATIADDIRAIVKSEAPQLALDDLGPVQEKVEGSWQQRRLTAEITTAFGWVALLLSGAGLYGVLAYLVQQRVREIGIRLALGATRQNVVGLIVRGGVWMMLGGLAIGWIGAAIAGRWVRSFLYGMTDRDPISYVGAAAVVLLAGAIAIVIPARRAASIEPMEALRTE